MEDNQVLDKNWYDKYYKIILVIPLVLTIIALIYLSMFYSRTGDFIIRDTTLAGGTTITIQGDIDASSLEESLESQFSDISIRSISDIRSGRITAVIAESSASPEEFKTAIEKYLGYELNETNSSIEFTGATLSEGFYRQLIIALIISFVLMSIVIFFLFRSFIPSFAVIFAAFADIVMPLALVNWLGIKISAAGIAAFLMLIGYSVDTDILLTTRVIKQREGSVNSRIYRSFKTGMLMTFTALVAVLPSFFLFSELPDTFRQIFLILALGLFADIINTWMTNTGIIKWYAEKRGIN